METKLRNNIFIFLTLSMIAFAGNALSALPLITQEASKTHLRWNLIAEKELLIIEKKGSNVYIKTLNSDLFEQLEENFKSFALNKSYIKGYTIVPPKKNQALNSIKLSLTNSNIELFSFYRERQKSYVLDFWIDQADKLKEIASKASIPKKLSKSKVKKAIKKKVSSKKKVVKAKKFKKRKVNKLYKDFRYGASFLWNYEPLSPSVSKAVRLDRKTPDFFFPIKNADYKKNDREAHLQLIVNFYRKKKWGLMYKSIKLFNEKYFDVEKDQYVGGDYEDRIEFLKANAILKENLERGSNEPVKMGIAILSNIASRSKNYDLKKAIYRYLLSYNLDKSDFVTTLDLAKKYYIESKDNYDYEELTFSSEVIVFSLSKLNQIDKVKKIILDPTIKKILPSQLLYAYRIFTHQKLGETDEVLKFYKKIKNKLQKPIHEIILFNVAEAMFQNAKYSTAIKLFDQFISDYSFHTYSSYARLRIALSYDLLGKDTKKVANLYKNTINRSQIADVGYEARIRYVGLETIRKNKLTPKDIEKRVFLDQKITKNLSSDLKRLLWQIRLRSFIKDEKYNEALSYLTVLPLKTMKPSIRKSFEADGAEIIFGLITRYFKNGEFAQVASIWEFYNEKYLEKVAADPFINEIVAKSYLKMGLMKSFDKMYERMTKLKNSVRRTFPVWIKRPNSLTTNLMLNELRIAKNIKLQNWELVKRNLKTLKKQRPSLNRISYYQGLVDYNQKKFSEAIKSFENFLYRQKRSDFYSANEVADILYAYTDSVYKSGNSEKYKKTAKAILNDTKSFAPNHKYTQNVRERVSYLYIETLAGEKKDSSSLLLEKYAAEFLKEFKESEYEGRIKFILASSLVSNKKDKDAIKMLNDLISDKKVSTHVKEMAKSELSLINIKNRNL